jgi:hypothetical protein
MIPAKQAPLASVKPNKSEAPKPGDPDTRLSGAVTVTGPTPPIQTAKLGAYVLEIYGQTEIDAPHMVFQKDGKTVKTVTVTRDENLQILNTEVCKLTDGKDPNVVVCGALDCYRSNCYVFSLGDKVKLISTICTAGMPELESAQEGTKKELRVSDPNLDWGAHGRTDSILIKWSKGRFVLDSQEMKKHNPWQKPCKGFDDAIVENFKRHAANPELDEQIISMCYCGDSLEAKKYLDHIWPKHLAGKADYWRQITAEMKVSPYWSGSKHGQ